MRPRRRLTGFTFATDGKPEHVERLLDALAEEMRRIHEEERPESDDPWFGTVPCRVKSRVEWAGPRSTLELRHHEAPPA